MSLNPMCCGSHCRSEKGPVKVYPLGGGANLILCRACWEWENSYRRGRGFETGSTITGKTTSPNNIENKFPTVNWGTAEVYGEEESEVSSVGVKRMCNINWDDPEARLALIESVGVAEYNRQAEAHRTNSTIEIVNGHRIRPVSSRFGRLFMVGDTGSAFATLEQARAFANKESPK
jgi:hypothetical protein